MRVPAITVRQPWATLLACGVKRFETRSWRTRYEGTIAIHASARLQPEDRIWAREDLDVGKLLRECGYADVTELPLGAILAVGTLFGCWPTRTFPVAGLSRIERALGDFSPGRWAWRLDNVVRLPEPVPARGSLGLWSCELDVVYPVGR